MKLVPLHPDYPRSLCQLDEPPILTLSGPLEKDRRVIAIVGSRKAPREARAYVHAMAYHLASAGIVIVSGGAAGVDTAAHEGALKAGATWCVACAGRRAEPFPSSNAELFRRIEQSSSSRMIWPFPDDTLKDEHTPRYRNGVLVGLAECVVVVQAGSQSGSRNAITWSRTLGRRLFLSPGNPWDPAYDGTMTEGAAGDAETLWTIEYLFHQLGLPKPDLSDRRAAWEGILPRAKPLRRRRRRRQTYSEGPLFEVDPRTWTSDEKTVFSHLSMAPLQQDTIVELAGLPTSSTLTALLTLSLKDVVVEGPDGFFRRRIAL